MAMVYRDAVLPSTQSVLQSIFFGTKRSGEGDPFSFKACRTYSRMSGAMRKTGLTGLTALQNPRLELKDVYDKLLRHLTKLPTDYVYRRTIEKVVKERMEMLQTGTDVTVLEERMGQGKMEEMIAQGKREIQLVHKLAEYKPWEDLVDKAPPHQWSWPPHN